MQNDGSSVFWRIAALFAFFVVVLPNSNRAISLPLFFLVALFSARAVVWSDGDAFFWSLWAASASVTLFYLLGPALAGKYDAVAWILFVYVVSPALWMIILRAALMKYSIERLIGKAAVLGALGAISVFVYYIVFYTMGIEYLTIFIAEPSAGFIDGQPAAAMHVYGSLVFICGGFFAAPNVVSGVLARSVLALLLIAAAVLSGRSALLLSIALGPCVAAVSAMRKGAFTTLLRQFRLPVMALGVLGAVMIALAASWDIDLMRLPTVVIDKIMSGGGEERVAQAASLYQGIADHQGLGAGHGVGAAYVRDDEQPWRYELLGLATVFRVGILGAIVYMLPVFVVLFRYGRRFADGVNTPAEDFLLGGFLAILMASSTNPYLESFEFQWMFALPFVYFAAAASRRPAG